MNIIYLHGFKSNSDSIKGRLLKQYCAEHLPDIKIHLPDLNMPPVEALKQISELIEALEDVALVGSSLGAFMRHNWSLSIIFQLY